jgi:septal ring factor EnvC (AmiA/AmiB activator)
MCKKLGVTGLVIVAALVSLWKLGWLPYIHQEVASIQDSMKAAVPAEKDIGVLERELGDLKPEINKQSSVVAKKSVELDKMNRALSLSATNMKEREEYLTQVRAAIKNDKEFVGTNGQKVSKDKLEIHFAQKFNEYKSCKEVYAAQAETIEHKKQELAAEEQRLQAMRDQLTKFKSRLELQRIELAKVRASQMQNSATGDDSQFTRVEKMFDELETKVATEKKQVELTRGADVDNTIQTKLETESKVKKAIEEYDEAFNKVASDKK